MVKMKFEKYTYHYTFSVTANSKKDGRSEIEANFSEGVRIIKDDMKLLKISHATKKQIKARLEMIEWEKQNYLEYLEDKKIKECSECSCHGVKK
jgi:hypothetical protein